MRLGILLTEEESLKAEILSNWCECTIHELIANALDTMFDVIRSEDDNEQITF
jgi:hypothetical protein